MPPGRATKASLRSAIRRLRSCMVSTTCSSESPVPTSRSISERGITPTTRPPAAQRRDPPRGLSGRRGRRRRRAASRCRIRAPTCGGGGGEAGSAAVARAAVDADRQRRTHAVAPMRCHSAASQMPPHSSSEISTAALARSLRAERSCISTMRSIAASMLAVQLLDDQHQQHRPGQQRGLDPAAAEPEGRRQQDHGEPELLAEGAFAAVTMARPDMGQPVARLMRSFLTGAAPSRIRRGPDSAVWARLQFRRSAFQWISCVPQSMSCRNWRRGCKRPDGRMVIHPAKHIARACASGCRTGAPRQAGKTTTKRQVAAGARGCAAKPGPSGRSGCARSHRQRLAALRRTRRNYRPSTRTARPACRSGQSWRCRCRLRVDRGQPPRRRQNSSTPSSEKPAAMRQRSRRRRLHWPQGRSTAPASLQEGQARRRPGRDGAAGVCFDVMGVARGFGQPGCWWTDSTASACRRSTRRGTRGGRATIDGATWAGRDAGVSGVGSAPGSTWDPQPAPVRCRLQRLAPAPALARSAEALARALPG